jgi:hypothetical protein
MDQTGGGPGCSWEQTFFYKVKVPQPQGSRRTVSWTPRLSSVLVTVAISVWYVPCRGGEMAETVF